jgi:hypothetical protein
VRETYPSLLTDTDINTMEALPTLDHIYTHPTMSEVNCAFDDIASLEAPGGDGMPALLL